MSAGTVGPLSESLLVDGALQSWLDQLQPASFRGVPFHVDTIEWTAGDNVVLREYPFQDLPTVFRMGRAAEEIKFSAYVIGDDYTLQRSRLMEALTGEGVLVHPTAGAMMAFVAGKFSVKENPTAEGGMARFDLHFVLAEPRRYPTAATSTAGTATNQAGAAKAAGGDAFAARFDPKDKPGWAVEKAVARLRKTLDGVIQPISKAAAGLNEFQAELNASYRAVVDGLETLVQAPRQLADAVLELYRLPTDMSQAAVRDFQAAFAWAFNMRERLPQTAFEVSVVPPIPGLVMYGTGTGDAVNPNTPGQQQAAELADAGDRLFETAAVAAWVEATAQLELAKRRLADEQIMRLVREASRAQAPASVPASAWHDAMMALHGAVLADLQTRSRDLVRLTSYTPESWQPVWYVSHRLYGTTAYADEILSMNAHIEHPLLVPPGVPLRIIRHD
jgi:prophage DNA circulation protein